MLECQEGEEHPKEATYQFSGTPGGKGCLLPPPHCPHQMHVILMSSIQLPELVWPHWNNRTEKIFVLTLSRLWPETAFQVFYLGLDSQQTKFLKTIFISSVDIHLIFFALGDKYPKNPDKTLHTMNQSIINFLKELGKYINMIFISNPQNIICLYNGNMNLQSFCRIMYSWNIIFYCQLITLECGWCTNTELFRNI